MNCYHPGYPAYHTAPSVLPAQSTLIPGAQIDVLLAAVVSVAGWVMFCQSARGLAFWPG